jgi:hypothetical protein
MEHEMKSVQDVVTDVSISRIHCCSINQMLFIFSAFCQQNAIAAERVQMGQRQTARVDSRGWQPSRSAHGECLGVCRVRHSKVLGVPNLRRRSFSEVHQKARVQPPILR